MSPAKYDPANADGYYCPAVEKITEPSGPFSPRGDVTGGTDRDYTQSSSSQFDYPNTCPGHTEKYGYTNVADPDVTHTDDNDPNKWPVVQCAIVPVDILTFRADAFKSCITNRLEYNKGKWLEAHMPDVPTLKVEYQTGGGWGDGWSPPCATHFWETDTIKSCPLSMSIQQCCHILIKDVVPANFLKMRTCAGLLQARREDHALQSWINNQTSTLKWQNAPTHLWPTGMTNSLGCYDESDHCTTSSSSGTCNTSPTCTMHYAACYGKSGAGYTCDLPTIANPCPGTTPPFATCSSFASSNAESPPVASITDDTFGSTGYSSYQLALTADRKLNKDLCDDTEPSEYRFDHQPWTEKADCPDDHCFGDSAGGDPVYLGVHMPYMRWWDTGVSAGNPRHGGSFTNTLGSFDTIVGVGRDERDEQAGKDASALAQKLGAPNDDVQRLKEYQPAQIGRIGGWAELKGHQMWTTRRSNDVCIGRYEKLFKYGAAEDLVLAKGGAGYTSRTGDQWPWQLGWRGYVTDSDGGNGGLYGANAFPSFLHGNWNVSGGLDRVLPGDIISYTVNGLPQLFYVVDIGGWATQGSDVPIDPGAGQSIKAVFCPSTAQYYQGGDPSNPCDDTSSPIHPTRIFVVGWDQGKFPTATGVGVAWGMGPERTIYKTSVPNYESEAVCNMKLRALTTSGLDFESACLKNDDSLDAETCSTNHCQPSCVDPDYPACVLPNDKNDWNFNVRIYRPSLDIAKCEGTPTFDAGAWPANLGAPPSDLDATYDWNGTGLRPDGVIAQNLTDKVDSNLWAYCVNAGYDPPPHFAKGYSGPQTGAITKTELCGPSWRYAIKKPNKKLDEKDPQSVAEWEAYNASLESGCSTAAKKYEWFPGLPPAPPPPPILGCRVYPIQYTTAPACFIPCGSPFTSGSCASGPLQFNAAAIRSAFFQTLPVNGWVDTNTAAYMYPVATFCISAHWCDPSIPP